MASDENFTNLGKNALEYSSNSTILRNPRYICLKEILKYVRFQGAKTPKKSTNFWNFFENHDL